MKCEICGETPKRLHKFYWGFFKTEYDPNKWALVCDNCRNNFLKESSYAQCTGKKDGLIEIENKIRVRRK